MLKCWNNFEVMDYHSEPSGVSWLLMLQIIQPAHEVQIIYSQQA